MEKDIMEFTKFERLMTVYGQEVLLALIILVGGLIATRLFIKLLRNVLPRFRVNQNVRSVVAGAAHVVLIVLVVAIALEHAGMASVLVHRVLAAIILAGVGLFVILRPYIPTLPFKVGNTIMTGDLLGKVESMTMLHTRLKTFDGKTVFVPNSKILNDYVINYHFTPSRRFEIDVGIGYDQDILRAKQVIEALLIEDPRVLKTPRPAVYVVNLADSCVELSGRAWIENVKYWQTKCDLLEKVKLRLDQEGVTIAFPQRDVHLHYAGPYPAVAEGQNPAS